MNHDLNRFKIAQESSFEQALSEIQNGKKISHWMWYIFPQIAGLGKSSIAKKFEIRNADEAEQYLLDKLLAERLIQLTKILVNEIEGKTAQEIFGFPDYLKFHSSMTLFYSIVSKNQHLGDNSDFHCFEDALKKYYNEVKEPATLKLLKSLSA